MLDIKLLRETPDVVRADLRKRGREPAVVDEFLEKDLVWREGLKELEALRALKNRLGPVYGPLARANSQISGLHSHLTESLVLIRQFEEGRGRSQGFLDWLYREEKRTRGYFAAVAAYAATFAAYPTAIRAFVLAFDAFVKQFPVEFDQPSRAHLVEQEVQIPRNIGAFQHLQEYASAMQNAKLAPKQVEEAYRKIVDSKILDAVNPDALQRAASRLFEPPSRIAGDNSVRIKQLEEAVANADKRKAEIHRSLPNIMHPSVPVGPDDSGNVEIRRWGKAALHDFTPVSHVDLLTSLDVADLERAARAAGARFYYAKGDLVLLGRALEFFALTRLAAKGFTAIEPPYMLRREAMEGAVDLADFESVIYKVEAEAKEPPLYLIATSEHPIAALHMGEILATPQLPLKYAGVSPCFRKEAGAHGKDTKGIFRVHQFSKVEQFVFCKAEDSWAMHEELIANAEALFRELGIPHRVVNICTGDLGSIAAKKYDIEAWMPVQGAYREVVSCSNCTDFQARRYNTRHRANPGDPTEIVHTLNSTAIAVQRTLVAILENFQQADGSVAIPKALQPYVGKAKMEPAKARA